MKQAETEVVMGDEQPRDRRGRRRLTRERRVELLKEYEGSGLTQAEFSRRSGLSKTTFSHWVQRARREAKTLVASASAAPVAVKPRFVEVQAARPVTPAMNVESATPPAGLSVSLPDGLVVRGDEPVALAALVRALRAN
jgi:transposase-like protein